MAKIKEPEYIKKGFDFNLTSISEKFWKFPALEKIQGPIFP